MKRAALLIGLLSLPMNAYGQSDPAAAEVLYNDAQDAKKRGDFAVACPKFEESYRLDPVAPTLVMVAVCEERAGKLADAWSHLQEAAGKLKDEKQIAVTRKLIAGVEPRVPRLTVRIAAGAPAGTTVRRDGIELRSASLATPLPVNPGEHAIVVSAPGRKDAIFKATVQESRTTEIEVSTGELDATSAVATPPANAAVERGPTPAGPTQSRGGGSKTLGYVLAGVGVVGLGVAGFSFSRVKHYQGAIPGSCSGDHVCSVQSDVGTANGAAADARTWTTPFYAGLVVGAIGVGAGAYFLLSSSGDGGVAIGFGPRGASVGGTF
jgi:hypothetical protein